MAGSVDDTSDKLDRAIQDSATLRVTILEQHGYKTGQQIGQGSYAKVKLAFSKTHASTVAIKIISKYRTPKDYLQNFLPRELAVVRGLQHPNLIRFYQSIETTHRVFIVMEYAENGSLLRLIQKEKRLKEDVARVFFKQLMSVVQYLHGRGVCHRDIKCENMLIAKDNTLKLIDFGFARADMTPPKLSDTFCGSYAYASPEILRGVPYQPQSSDIWATGVVLYAMVVGRLPFDDSSVAKLIKQVEAGVVFPSTVAPRLSQIVKGFIPKILAPLKTRLSIDQILNEPWMLVEPSKPIESDDAVSQD